MSHFFTQLARQALTTTASPPADGARPAVPPVFAPGPALNAAPDAVPHTALDENDISDHHDPALPEQSAPVTHDTAEPARSPAAAKPATRATPTPAPEPPPRPEPDANTRPPVTELPHPARPVTARDVALPSDVPAPAPEHRPRPMQETTPPDSPAPVMREAVQPAPRRTPESRENRPPPARHDAGRPVVPAVLAVPVPDGPPDEDAPTLRPPAADPPAVEDAPPVRVVLRPAARPAERRPTFKADRNPHDPDRPRADVPDLPERRSPLSAPPAIRVSIGRVEVRAAPPPRPVESRTPRPAPPRPALSLSDYLRQRQERRR